MATRGASRVRADRVWADAPSGGGLWSSIALACVAWDAGRFDPAGADHLKLVLFNSGYALSVAVFAVAIVRSIAASSSPAARQKLALDLLPHQIMLAVVAWLLWLG